MKTVETIILHPSQDIELEIDPIVDPSAIPTYVASIVPNGTAAIVVQDMESKQLRIVTDGANPGNTFSVRIVQSFGGIPNDEILIPVQVSQSTEWNLVTRVVPK